MTDLESWQAVGVAAALGLLIGAERERSHPVESRAGIRTFALAAVLGCVAMLLPMWVGVALVAVAGLMIVVGYGLSQTREPGMTTEVALLMTLALGALATTEAGLAAGIAVGTTALLVSKEALHRFVQQTVSDLERTDALKFLIAAFIVLPLLPSSKVGPYGVWDPRQMWTLVVLITGVGWLGYAATRLLGPTRGLMIAGLAGGFVSGVATTGAMAARSRDTGREEAALAGAVMASLSTLILLGVLLTFVEPSVALNLMPGLVVGGLALLGEAWWVARQEPPERASSEVTGRPFALAPALVLTVVLSSVLLASRWLADVWGSGGAVLVAGIGGLADAHGTSVAAASLVSDGALSTSIGVAAVAVALGTNTIVKFIAAFAGGGRTFTVRLAWLLAPAIAAVAVAAVF